MPPKAKFTREEIIEKAIQIARTEGMDKITARELGKQLNSSSRPIFTVFESMDEVKQEVICYAKELYKQYVAQGLKADLAFKGVGIAYITFAIEEPKLFQLLFMTPQIVEKNVTQILPQIDESYNAILQSVQEPYGLDRQMAERLYQHLWTYTHGIATMCATGICNYSMEQISTRTTEIFRSLLTMIKRGELK